MQEEITKTENDESLRRSNSYDMRKSGKNKRARAWIEDRLAEIGKPKTGLGEALGLPPPRITEILDGDRTVKLAELRPLADYLELSIDHVLSLEAGAEVIEPLGQFALRKVYVTGEIQAGVFKEVLEWPQTRWRPVTAPVDPVYAQYPAFGVLVVGTSMNKRFPPGTVAICVRLLDLGPAFVIPSGKYVVVYNRNNLGEIEATIKQYEVDGHGQAWLWPRSDDPAHQAPIKVRDLVNGDDDDVQDDIQIWALVVGKYESI